MSNSWKYLYFRGGILIAFLTLLLEVSSAQTPATNQERQENSILIINSYTQFDEQGRNISEEIKRRILKKDSSRAVIINYAQMNTLTSIMSFRYSMRSLCVQYLVNPKILILIGDEAWMTYRVMRLHSFNKTNVILCCVHEDITSNLAAFFTSRKIDDNLMIPTADSLRTRLATGVFEQYNTRQTISLMKRTLPQMEEVVFITTGTYTDTYLENKLRKTIQADFPELRLTVNKEDKKDVKNSSTTLPLFNPKRGVLVNLWYQMHRQFFDSIQRNTKLNPLFLINERILQDNRTIGGCYPTYKSYTDSVMEIIMRIDNGEDPRQIPFKTVIDSTPRINISAMENYNLDTRIPKAAYYNYPPTFLERRQNEIAIFILVFIIVISWYFISRNAIRFKKRMILLFNKKKNLYEEFLMASEIMPVALFFFDSDGKLLRKNGEAKRNISLKETISDGEMCLFDANFLTEEHKKAIRNMEPVDLKLNEEQRLIIRYYLTSKDIKSKEQNNTLEIILILIESRALNQERIKNQSFRTIFEYAMKASNMGVAEYNLIDKKGFATKTWYNNLNLTEEDGFKDPLASIDVKDRREIQLFLEEARRGINNNFNRNIQVRNANGEKHWLNYAIYVMAYSPSEGRIMIAETCVNIDEQKDREYRLEQEMKKAQESDLLKSAFIANMSHEIRTPLNAIIGFSDMLIETEDAKEKEELMQHIEYNNASLLGLVEDIIELARVESEVNKPTYSETDINFLLNDLVLYCQMEGAKNNLKVTFEKPEEKCIIITDKMRLKQVISNFVTNALKFTKAGEITIGYYLIDDMIKIYVSDTGIGISEEGCKKVFNRFVVLEHGIKGNGLGLSISKSIVTHLDGEIGVDSVEGGGSTFWCIIPCNRDVKIAEIQMKQSKEESKYDTANKETNEILRKKIKILVAEDEEMLYNELKEIMCGNYELTYATNGEEVIELFLNDIPDMIFMDLVMPLATGYEAAAAIRNIANNLPIIATIDVENISDSDDLLKKGFNDVICHPYKKDEVFKTIERWMKGGNI